jgi:hypothetical protein
MAGALRAPDAPGVFVVGDAALVMQNEHPVPGVAQAAIQEGRCFGRPIGEAISHTDRGAIMATEWRIKAVHFLTGGETDDMTTIWWVFSAMCPNKLEPLFLPIEVAIDVEARRGHIRVPGIIETVGEPIRNPVTGAEHRARIEMPEGVEFRIAEASSGTTRTTGQIPLPDLENTHAQFAHIHSSNKGVVD